MSRIYTHKDLMVFQKAYAMAILIFQITGLLPKEERFALIDQIRRSSRSVAANIAEAYRKRIYPKSFIAKLVDAEGEAAETQVWLDYALNAGYLDLEQHRKVYAEYDEILSLLVYMRKNHQKFL